MSVSIENETGEIHNIPITCRGSKSSADEGVGPLRAGATDILEVLAVMLTSAAFGIRAKLEVPTEESGYILLLYEKQMSSIPEYAEHE